MQIIKLKQGGTIPSFSALEYIPSPSSYVKHDTFLIFVHILVCILFQLVQEKIPECVSWSSRPPSLLIEITAPGGLKGRGGGEGTRGDLKERTPVDPTEPFAAGAVS